MAEISRAGSRWLQAAAVWMADMIQTGFDPDVLATVLTVMCETHLGRGVSTAEVQEQASEVLEATRAYLTEVGA